MLNSTEKIGRIVNTELESGAHKHGFTLAPGVTTTLALGLLSVGDCERSSRHSPVHAFLALSSEAVTGAGADG
jgi:hypothetical protein